MKRINTKPRAFKLAIAALSAALLNSCAPSQPDIHASPRESKAYEAIAPAELDKAGLLAHLETMKSEILAATQAGQASEFHHLDVAFTATLEALETIAIADNNLGAVSSISTLKPLSEKLHEAGHQNSAKTGAKLGPAIAAEIDRLSTSFK